MPRWSLCAGRTAAHFVTGLTGWRAPAGGVRPVGPDDPGEAIDQSPCCQEEGCRGSAQTRPVGWGKERAEECLQVSMRNARHGRTEMVGRRVSGQGDLVESSDGVL